MNIVDELTIAAYHALKSVSRKNLVIGGMTFTGGNIERDAIDRANVAIGLAQVSDVQRAGHSAADFRRIA